MGEAAPGSQDGGLQYKLRIALQGECMALQTL